MRIFTMMVSDFESESYGGLTRDVVIEYAENKDESQVSSGRVG